MKSETIRCQSCGAPIPMPDDKGVVQCPYCNTVNRVGEPPEHKTPERHKSSTNRALVWVILAGLVIWLLFFSPAGRGMMRGGMMMFRGPLLIPEMILVGVAIYIAVRYLKKK